MSDCSTCPSRLRGDEVKEFYGRDFGPDVDVCAQHGHVLGRPGLDAAAVTRVHVSFGTRCATPNAARPSTRPTHPEARVCAPSPEVFVNDFGQPRATPTPEVQAAVASCRDCQWFVPDSVVRDELGWYLPMCAASGRLLMPNRLRNEPKSCGRAESGANRSSTEKNVLRPEYDDAFKFGQVGTANSPVAAFIASGGQRFVEPTEYPTDAPVSSYDEADGIRAWRKITSPDDPTKNIMVPIFRTDFFGEFEQGLIPKTGDDEHPEWYVDHAGLLYDLAVEMMELEETPVLIGAAGTGKTELFRHFAWLCHLPFHRISITRSSEVEDLAGKWLFTDGETRWADGRVARAYTSPSVLLIDEPNVGPDEVWQFFRPMFDNSKQLVLDQAKGEKRVRHAWCFLGLAMNPAWDMKYVGTNELSTADQDRLTPMYLELPPADVEKRIIAQRCIADGYEISDDTLAKVMAIAEDIRAECDPVEGTLPISWGLRPQIKVARKTRWYDLTKAYKRAICDGLDPQTSETIMRIVRGYDE